VTVRPASELGAADDIAVAIVGAGACGLTAALAAHELGAEVVVLERDAVPSGSTALSAGLIPAAGTRFQRARRIDDDPALFAADIMAKNLGRADPEQVALIAREGGPAIEWLADRHGLQLDLVEGFRYPGHSRLRMHGTPRRAGAELIDQLRAAVERADIPLITDAAVTTLFADDGRQVHGLAFRRPDGREERLACRALVLACNGYGGARDLVATHIPEMAGALYFGHPGNQGDAIRWGAGLGARAADLGAYQGHGSVASPHGILITWAVIMEGGFQVNTGGHRFSDEAHGYSEQAVNVLAQPGAIAYSIFDARIAAVARQFEDFREAEAQGAIRQADSVAGLAALLDLDPDALAATFAAVDRAKDGAADPFGRNFAGVPRLVAPFHAVRVTGALFHTQGGLAVDREARVLDQAGRPLPNLFAGGGAARGISGDGVAGYLSGNGLASAVTLGRLAGTAAGRLVAHAC
jgi:fumarate reductase flavoprotein subunit